MQILEAASSAKRGTVRKLRSSTAQPASAQIWRAKMRDPDQSALECEVGSLVEKGTGGPEAIVAEDLREGTGGGETQVGT